MCYVTFSFAILKYFQKEILLVLKTKEFVDNPTEQGKPHHPLHEAFQ
jgi:hypothetical protein